MENQEIKPKTDCFAYPEAGKSQCYALNDLYCKKEKCSFYRPNTEITKAQIERELRGYTGSTNVATQRT